MKIDQNACDFIENHSRYMPLPMSKEMMELVKAHTNFQMRCPYKANVSKKARINLSNIIQSKAISDKRKVLTIC